MTESYRAPLCNECEIGAPEYLSQERNVFLLDVRTPAEYNYAHIEGATLIPLRNVPSHDPVNLSDNKLLPKE